jgi:hypothetical protein
MPEHNLFRIFVSRFNKLSIPDYDSKILEAQINKRALEKEWNAAKNFKV